MWNWGQSPFPHSKKKQNMKKTYIKPSTEEIKIQAPQVLVGSEEIPLEWGDLLG